MSVTDFHKEARGLNGTSEYSTRKDLLDADSFSVVLYTHVGSADTGLHDCSRDEFFMLFKETWRCK